MTPAEAYVQHVMNYRLEALKSNRPTISVPAFGTNKAFTEPNLLAQALAAVTLKLDALASQPTEPQPAPIVTDEQLERVFRKVLGGVDGASPGAPA